ncbi:MAG: hypothetical protein QF440_04720 [Candidatus Thalassarchaeaceae archaeon]|jgi:hypothetical protein|nr:hypothetical protein [Candidatus Thalassarchaeaceae archaeon]
MAIGGGDAFSPSAALLTIALLGVPPLLMFHSWLPEKFSRYAHFVPCLILSITVFFRIHALWNSDGHDSQVVEWLPEGINKFSAIPYVFSGPAGIMFGLLLGFSIGIAIRKTDNVTLRIHRWAALCWIVLLGWGTPSDGFARSIEDMSLSAIESPIGWQNMMFPILGIGLSLIVLPTLSLAEISSPRTIHPLRLIASVCVIVLLLDLSSEKALSALMILIIAAIYHLIISAWVHQERGLTSSDKWKSLQFVFFHSTFVLIIGTSLLSMSEPNIGTFGEAIWSSRIAIGWILVCGLGGALLPTIGFDSRPRPEVWGFLSGFFFAPAFLPRLEYIEFSFVPILILVVTMPILATSTETHPSLTFSRKTLEISGLILIQVFLLILASQNLIPISLLVVFIGLPVVYIHLKSWELIVDEEE